MKPIEISGGILRRWLLPIMACALMAGILLGRAAGTWIWAAAAFAAAALSLILSVRVPMLRRIAVIALTLAAGAGLGWHMWHHALPEERNYHVTGIIAEEIRDGDNSQHKTLLRSLTLDGKAFNGGAYWSFYSDTLPEGIAPGAAIEADLRLYHPSGAKNPGGFDFKEYLLQRNCSIGLYGMDNLVVSRGGFSVWGSAALLRHKLTRKLQATMGEEAGGYAATMLLGSRSLVNTEDRDAFARLGIAHVLSVSGFHVGVLFGAIAWLLNKIRVPRKIRFPIITLFLFFYCVLTGMGAPVLRASVLVILNEWGHLRNRPREPLHLLSAAALITLIISPAQLTGAGFQLSYGALLGLVLILPTLEHFTRTIQRKPIRWLSQGLCASIAVQVGILLPQLYWYQQFPVISLVLNPFVLVGASFLLMIYWAVLLLMAVPGLGPVLGSFAGQLTNWLTAGVRRFGNLEWVSVWTKQANLWTVIGCLILFAVLGWIWHDKTKLRRSFAILGTAVVVLSVIAWPRTGSEYIQLSVGNADAAVLRDQDTVWVIDTGDSATLSEYLRQQRLPVDTLVISHLHKDHVMGIYELVNDHIPVKRLILPVGAERQKDIAEECLKAIETLKMRGTEIIHAARGETYPLPSGEVAVLWPEHGRVRSQQDPNQYSLTLSIRVNGVTLLTGGDLTSEYEMYSAVPTDILKAAHHGAKGSTQAAYLEAVDPKLILLSNQREDRYEGMLERAGDRPVVSTQTAGAIIITFGDREFTCKTFRPTILQNDPGTFTEE